MTNPSQRVFAMPGKPPCARDDYRCAPQAGGRIRARLLGGLCLWIMALAWCSIAQAQSCTASMSPIAFGNYSPIGNAAATTSGTLTVSCTFPLVSLSTVRVCFNLGTGSTSTGSSLPPRTMGNGTNRLSYNLAQTSTPGVLWGATAAGTTPISITFAAAVVGGTLTRTIPITGTILPNQPTVPTVNNTTTTYTEDYTGTAATANYGFYVLGGPPACSALTSTTTFPFSVTANVTNNCTIAANTMNFAPAGLLTAATLSTSNINVTCTNNNAYRIALNGGGTGNVAARRLTRTGGTETIAYSLFTTEARNVIWGDGTAGTATRTGLGTGLAQTLTVYGRVPAQTTPRPGTYNDTITATITF